MNVEQLPKKLLTGFLVALMAFSGCPAVPVAIAQDDPQTEAGTDPQTRTYTVVHVLQDLDGTYGTVADTETLEGAVGDTTRAAARDYEGFTCLGVENQTIGVEGDIAITVRYARNAYYGTWVDGYSDEPHTERYLFGQTLAYAAEPDVHIDGHTFLRWQDIDGVAYDSATCATMPARDLTLYAIYDPAIEAGIMVEYYVQSASDGPDAAEKTYGLAKRVDSATAPVGDSWAKLESAYATYAESGMDFDFDAEATAAANEGLEVLPDGSSVFKVYFNRPVVRIEMQYWKGGAKANAVSRGSVTGLFGASTAGVDWPVYTHEAGEPESWDGDYYWMAIENDGRITFVKTPPTAFYYSQAYMKRGDDGVWTITLASYASLAKYYNATSTGGNENPASQYAHLEGLEDNTWPDELSASSRLGNYTTAIAVTEDGQEGFTTAAGRWGDFIDNIETATIDFTYYWTRYNHAKITLNWGDPNGQSVYPGSSSKFITHDAHIYYTRNSYTLSFENTGDVESATLKYQAPLATSLPAADKLSVPAHLDPESVFAGWYYDAACTKPVGEADTMPAKNVSLVAKWTLPEKTVTLMDGDTRVGAATCLKNGTVYDTLDQVELELEKNAAGRTFTGWYKDAALTQPFMHTEKITADTKLWAGWSEEGAETRAYVVRYVDGEGNALLGSEKGVAGKDAVLYFEAPTIEGWRAQVASANLTLAEDGTVTFIYDELDHVQVTPASMTAYVGGISRNGSHLPKLRYAVSTPDDTSLADLSFDIVVTSGGTEYTEHLDRASLGDNDEASYCLFPQLGYESEAVSSTLDDTTMQRYNFVKLVDRDGNSATFAGVYDFALRTGENADWDSWRVTATDTRTGEVYLVDIEPAGASVTVREVSDEALMYGDPASLLTAVAHDASAAEGVDKAVAVVDESTDFATNGDEALGLLGTDDLDEVEGYGDQTALVALLFDDVMSTCGADDATEEMVGRAEEATGESLEGWNAEFKYLDLVNVNDGNAVVTARAPVTVVWPYPEGMTYETASGYEFKVLHYKGMERDSAGPVETDGYEVETLVATPTEYGLAFETESFSPFGLVWREKGADAAGEDVTDGAPSDGGTAATTRAGDKAAAGDSGQAAGAGGTPSPLTADATLAGTFASAVLAAGAAASLAIRRRIGRRRR
jgi:uncharacterized repeat protein (TIGR02543 family)